MAVRASPGWQRLTQSVTGLTRKGAGTTAGLFRSQCGGLPLLNSAPELVGALFLRRARRECEATSRLCGEFLPCPCDRSHGWRGPAEITRHRAAPQDPRRHRRAVCNTSSHRGRGRATLPQQGRQGARACGQRPCGADSEGADQLLSQLADHPRQRWEQPSVHGV
jgi:hypothetical protein